MQDRPRGTPPEEDSRGTGGGDNEPVTNVRTALERLRAPAREAVRDAGSPTGPPLRLSRRARQFDVLVALVIGVSTVYYGIDNVDNVVLREIAPGVEVAVPRPSGTGGLALMVTLAAVASGALALRRRHPLAVLCVVTAATLATPESVLRLTFYAFVIAVYSAAVYSPYRVATLAALPVSVVLVGTSGNSVTPVVPNEYIALLILVPMAVAAVGLRTWKLRTDEGRTRLIALEREQAEALRGAVEHERARIARELHDVVTHHVSVMIIQAGAARKIMESSPGQAGEALLAVEAGGRAAMTELRHVMGLLTMNGEGERADGTEAGTEAELSPQPGLDQLGTLVGRVRDAGQPVTLTATGRPRAVPSGVGLAAYRVVQEALTNTVTHASGATARVTVGYAPEQLRVEVTDTGGGAGTGAGNGRGLIGLRERLTVYGGTLSAGRCPAGGYRVEALIPLEAP
ncbi:histidine kinase [Streptomyces sp. NBC_01201]|uniref:histidine kinase n=1 Tax=Streptomyces glycanivorans TaxID=3033808 RepID=A0ABY9JIX6_9ACTN|nr:MULTISPECIES: histidine kinase [unclassified Streptomyces]WLQ67686.1 histidine kinase [Streptomyces sp. Alt3]WSQ81027.1 histidine kinase [Streptomyces sp. NBC_01213]WSR05636.1 histidine kinase [Streptomyces sp. NBC_01208]WSR51753.1 histidine kinase [Streptomyces sp. NBC_01201]